MIYLYQTKILTVIHTRIKSVLNVLPGHILTQLPKDASKLMPIVRHGQILVFVLHVMMDITFITRDNVDWLIQKSILFS